MKNKILFLAAALGLSTASVCAQDDTLADTTKKAPVEVDLFAHAVAEPQGPKVPLSRYTFGVGVGGIYALNTELKDVSEAFLKLSIINSISVNERVNANFDLDWLLPGPNFGGNLGFDFLLVPGNFSPFVGLGVGLYAFDKEKWEDGFGVAGMGWAGFHLGLTETLQLRLRALGQFIASKDQDQTAGVDVALLFGSAQRKTMVRKLQY